MSPALDQPHYLIGLVVLTDAVAEVIGFDDVAAALMPSSEVRFDRGATTGGAYGALATGRSPWASQGQRGYGQGQPAYGQGAPPPAPHDGSTEPYGRG